MRLLPLAKIQRPATMSQPTHNDAVAANHLHTIDTKVLSLLQRASGDDQTPRDQRTGITRPAGLHRQLAQIDLIPLNHIFLTRCRALLLWRHIKHFAEERHLLPGILHPFWWIGLLQHRQQATHLPQCGNRLFAHTQRDPIRCPEEVGQ